MAPGIDIGGFTHFSLPKTKDHVRYSRGNYRPNVLQITKRLSMCPDERSALPGQ
jgi:hypothetical protein